MWRCAGIGAWEFVLVEDSSGGECTCFGAVTAPVTDFNYNNPNAYMYRAYNGQLYGKSIVGSSRTKVRLAWCDMSACEKSWARK
jgi:hypothetical protein